MSNLATATPTALDPLGRQLSRDKVELLKRTICKGATDDELEFFLCQCSGLGLDPFSKQVYAVKRWDSNAKREVMAIQIGIDGMRSQAESSGDYRGQTEPLYCGKDGQWVDVWLQDGPPAAAKVGVYRDGFLKPVFAIAKYSSYVQTKKDGSPTKFWVQMPDVMLAKCAESLALRKAFPKKLSGIYSNDEMGQAQNVHVESVEVLDDRDWKSILDQLGWSVAQLKETALANGLPASSRDLTPEQSDQLLEAVLIRRGLESGHFKAVPHVKNSLAKIDPELDDGERIAQWSEKLYAKTTTTTPGLE